jgi:hypothetical protein
MIGDELYESLAAYLDGRRGVAVPHPALRAGPGSTKAR